MKLKLVLVLAVGYSMGLHGAEHERRGHESHEHGVGQLNVAVEMNSLHIELESPAMNIVGFEHRPRNQQQKDTVHDAVTLLKQGDLLFSTSKDAGCILKESEVVSGLLDKDEEHHEDEGDEAHHHQESHADFEASYLFECNKPSALKRLTVKLFAAFPATEELEVQLLTSTRQSALEITSDNPWIDLLLESR